MNRNYNDIIDVILTFSNDEEISKNVAVSGSIVPYIITNKESFEYHSDFYFLVKQKKIKSVRSKIKELSKEYKFDIVSDSSKYSRNDCGFKISYENTIIGFFPYSLIDNNLTIKTFSISKDKKEIRLKTKVIPGVSKNSVIRSVNFNGDRYIRILSPEFILANKEAREKQPGNPTKETMVLLDKLSDERVLNAVRKSVGEIKVKIDSKSLKCNERILEIILLVLFLLLIILAYICFKK